MKPKILLTGPIHAQGLRLLEELLTVQGDTKNPMARDDVLRLLEDKEGIVLASLVKVDTEFLNHAPNLKVISTVSVGYDHINVEETTRRGVYVCNTPGVLTDCVAEITWSLILSAYKRTSEAEKFMRANKWIRGFYGLEFLGRDLGGKVMGIIGLGRIGIRVAEIAKCFGMTVKYFDVIKHKDADKMGIQYCELDKILSGSDIVSIHVPLTKENYHLIGEKELKIMKKDAILINTSRGSIINERALIEALKEKRIGGAGLDVFEVEPLPLDSELLRLENVVLSPHRGSASVETRASMAKLAARNLIAVLKGEMPFALVNPEVTRIRPLGEVKLL